MENEEYYNKKDKQLKSIFIGTEGKQTGVTSIMKEKKKKKRIK